MELVSDLRMRRERIDNLMDDCANGLLARPELARAKQTAEGLAHLEKRISGLTRSAGAGRLLPIGETVGNAWDKNDLRWPRLLISLLLDKIVVNPSPGAPHVRNCDRYGEGFHSGRKTSPSRGWFLTEVIISGCVTPCSSPVPRSFATVI